jgi:gliding motility-associated-like protein
MRQATWIFMLFFGIFAKGQESTDFLNYPSKPLHYNNGKESVTIDHISYLNVAQTTGSRAPFVLSLPIYGDLKEFDVIPNEVIDDESRRLYPDLLTFDLRLKSDPSIYGALTLSASGLYAAVYNMGNMVSIYPDNPKNTKLHIVEYGIQPDIKSMKQFCGHDHSVSDMIRKPSPFKGGNRTNITMGTKRHSYDVAIVTTGEFYQNNGNTDPLVRTAVVNTVNAISAIFSNEMSIKLAVGTRITFYEDPDTDIFIPDELGGDGRPDQAGNAVAMHWQPNRYDIGHVFHQHANGDGWSNGGVAQLRSVCNDGGIPISKARGWSGAFSNVGNGWINLATHEFGHQFGANHTFNGDGGACTDAIDETNAYEIGSGTTIMSYNGLCNTPQNIPASDALDNYFHIKSLEEIYEFVYNGTGGLCGSPTNSPNQPPRIWGINQNFTIPKNTPFFLDELISHLIDEQESLTFCWEQIDEDGPGKPSVGKIGPSAGSDSSAPLFRSYPPSKQVGRYFPALSILTSGIPSPFEPLPTVARTMNFNLSARDNNSGGGIIANNDIQVTVSSTGPLEVTSQMANEVLIAGQPFLVTWNTNGSNALCNNVRIKISSDGGLSYPFTVAENVPYASGSFNVQLSPNFISSTTVRIMVECMDNEWGKFFNISKTNASISSTCLAPNNDISPLTSKILLEGDPGLNLQLKNNIGKQVTNFNGNVRSTDIAGNLAFLNGTPLSCTVTGNNVNGDLIFFTVDVSGSYTITHGVGSAVLNLYQNEFTGTNCTNHVTSSGVRPSGSGPITTTSSLTANLTAGTHYYLFMSSFNTTNNIPEMPFNYNITFNKPAGANVYDGVKLPVGYAYTYVAVIKETGKIATYNDLSDFRTINAGTYCVYGVAYLPTNSPETWTGKSLVEIITDGNCVNLSKSCVEIMVLPACRITDVLVGNQTPCVAASNSFTQEVFVFYDKEPASGNLSVNGQQFAITGSPQSVTLVNLDSDGQSRDIIAFFTDAQNCRFEKSNVFTGPTNCCPLSFDLGPDINKCVGESVLLNGGNDGVTYIWRKDGIDQPGTTSKTFPVSTSGVYEVEVTHSSGCKKTDRITITFNALPTVLLADGQKFCVGESFELSANVNGAQTFEWYRNNGLISNETTNKIEITLDGLYRLVAISEFGCRGIDETLVNTIAAPVVELGNNAMKCEGDTVILNAGPDGSTYQWFKDGSLINNATLQTYEVVQSGIYRVVVTNSDLCMTNDEVTLSFFASPVVNDFPTLINICQGAPSNITGVASDYQTLQWYYDNNPISGSNGLTLPISNSGLYSLEAVNLAGCKTRKSVQVEIRSLPAVDLGEPTLVSCIGNPVNLDGGPDGATYKWSKDGTNLTQNSRILSVVDGGVYRVTVTNQFNCVKTDEITLSFIVGPTLALNGDATICEGTSHQIVLTTNASNPEIKWFNAQGQITGESGSSLAVSEAGTYRVNVKGGSPACEVSESVTINVNPRPALNLGNNRTLCDGDTPPVLNGGPGNTSYVWTLNGAPLAMTQNVTANASGLYVVTVKNSFDCSRTEQVRITFEPKPTLNDINDSYDLCDGQSLTVNVESNGSKFAWKKSGTTIQGETTKTLVIGEEATYTIIVSNAVDCRTEKEFVVTSRPRPIIELGADFDLCPGESKILNAGTHTEYIWSNNSNGPTLQVIAGQPTTVTNNRYTVIVKNEFGCEANDTINARVFPIVKAEILADKPGVCNGEPVNLTASGGLIYVWTDPAGNSLSNTNQAMTVASPLTTTTYTVEVSDGICVDNIDSKSIEIKVFEPNDISAGVDTCVIIGRTIKLGASGGTAYQWDNINLIEGPSNIANPVIKPLVETVFTVTITDTNGCEFTDDVKVCVKEDNFKAVSIITPNGDGKNDELFFGNLDDYPDNTLKVFNRWGNVIFEAEGYQINGPLFDGYRNGEKLPADTYYYILTFDNQVIKSALTILWD